MFSIFLYMFFSHHKAFSIKNIVMQSIKVLGLCLLVCKDVACCQPASDLRAYRRGRGVEWQEAHLV